MTITKLDIREQPAPILMRHYNRRIARNIWIALRDQKMNSIRGQQRFADEVYDVLTTAPAEKLPTYQDGKRYEIPDAGISYKTISNFSKRASEIFQSVSDGGAPEVRVANETLAYLHAFLFLKQPERVAAWRYCDPKDYDNGIVLGLDDTFDRFKPAHSVPASLVFFAIRSLGKTTGSLISTYIKAKNKYIVDSSKFADYQGFSKLLGSMVLFERADDLEDECVFLTPSQWEAVRFNYKTGITKSQKEFKSDTHLYRGRASGICLKDLFVDNGFSIPRHQFAILCKVVGGVDKIEKFVGFRMSDLSWGERSSPSDGVLDDLLNLHFFTSIEGTELGLNSIKIDDDGFLGNSNSSGDSSDRSDVGLIVLRDTNDDVEEFIGLCRMMK